MKKNVLQVALAMYISSLSLVSYAQSATGAGAYAAGTGNASGITSIAVGDSAQAADKSTIALGTSASAQLENAIAIGNSASSTKEHTVTIGTHATSSGAGAIAIGNQASSSVNNSTAIGVLSVARGVASLALGQQATSSGLFSVALGSQSSDGGETGVVSVGSNSFKRKIINVGAGVLSSASTDAVNGSQLFTVKTIADSGAANAAAAQTTADSAMANAAAAQTTANTGVANAAAAQTTADSAMVKAATAQAKADNSVQYSGDTVVLENPSGAGGAIQIKNLAAGTGVTDAVNVGQMNTAIGSNSGTIGNTNITGTSSTDYTTQAANSALTQANAYTNQAVSNLGNQVNRRIDGLTSTVNQNRYIAGRGIAGAMAMTQISQVQQRPGQFAVGAALGYYDTSAALSVGGSYLLNSGKTKVNLGTMISQGGTIGGAVGFSTVF